MAKDFHQSLFLSGKPPPETPSEAAYAPPPVDLGRPGCFYEAMLKLQSHREIKEYLLHNERYLTVQLLPDTVQAEAIGKALKDVRYPSDVLVAMIERNGATFPPHGSTVLQENDVLTIIGEPRSISQLFDRYIRMNKKNEKKPLRNGNS